MPSERISDWIRFAEGLNERKPLQQYFAEREVWHCLLGINVGQEQNGDRGSFLRPVLVIQRFGQHLFWVVPLSTKTPIASQHHHLFKISNVQYSALVTQLRVLDASRLVRKIYALDIENFYEIKLHLARYLL